MRDAVAAVRERLDRAGGSEVRLVAVTKGFGPDAVRAVLEAGCPDIGESYAQETVAKCSALGLPLDVDARHGDPHSGDHRSGDVVPVVHFVGRLQSNKVRVLVPFVDRWDSLDRTDIVDAVARRAPGARVLLQVNTSGEDAKAGVAPDEVGVLVERARHAGLEVDGLMTIGPLHGGPEAARPGFRLLRRLADDHGLAECSMGMSDDLEVAVEEGSTQVRVGTAIFGPRPERAGQVG